MRKRNPGIPADAQQLKVMVREALALLASQPPRPRDPLDVAAMAEAREKRRAKRSLASKGGAR